MFDGGGCRVRINVGQTDGENRMLRTDPLTWCFWHYNGLASHIRLLDIDKRVNDHKQAIDKRLNAARSKGRGAR